MLDDLLNSRPGTHSKLPSMGVEIEDGKDHGVNFTMFLTMMGEHLFEFDTEADLIEAFESFDENDTGMVKCSDFRRWLAESGDKMDDREVRTFRINVVRVLNPTRLIGCLKVHLPTVKAILTTGNGSRFYESMKKRKRTSLDVLDATLFNDVFLNLATCIIILEQALQLTM